MYRSFSTFKYLFPFFSIFLAKNLITPSLLSVGKLEKSIFPSPLEIQSIALTKCDVCLSFALHRQNQNLPVRYIISPQIIARMTIFQFNYWFFIIFCESLGGVKLKFWISFHGSFGKFEMEVDGSVSTLIDWNLFHIKRIKGWDAEFGVSLEGKENIFFWLIHVVAKILINNSRSRHFDRLEIYQKKNHLNFHKIENDLKRKTFFKKFTIFRTSHDFGSDFSKTFFVIPMTVSLTFG